MLNHKTIFKQKSKSKIFITILCIFGLLFSYSCKCKNQVSDPNNVPTDNGLPNPDGTPPGTFSMSAATNNVTDNFIVKSASTVGEIKIAFVSANNYAYTSSYEVVDNDTTEANRITTAETTYANNVLTIKDTAIAKVRQLDSSAGPAEKTITINFTFKANDSSLKNNTQTLSVEVKLTHAQKFTVGSDGANPENKLLQDAVKLDTFVTLGNNIAFNAIDSSMTISQDGKEVTFENVKNSESEDTNISKLTKDIFLSELPYTTHFKDFEITSVDIDSSDTKIAIIKLTFTPKDEYEFVDPTITVKLKLKTKNWIK